MSPAFKPTVFQIVYADGKVMLDSGMDEQVHRFFGRGTVEPYDPDAAKQVEQALRSARAIIITHEHGDHVAGVIRTPFLAELAPKTLIPAPRSRPSKQIPKCRKSRSPRLWPAATTS